MKHHDGNPYLKAFAGELPERYPVSDVTIAWDDDDEGRVKDVVVQWWPPTVLSTTRITDPIREAYGRWEQQWESTRGRCDYGWPAGEPWQTPEALFAEWIVGGGFADKDAFRKALVELGRIEECEWARKMLAVLPQVEEDKWPNDIKPPVHFENTQWVVTDYGLECRDSYYPIEGDRLGEWREVEGKKLSDWLLHMAEKPWVNYPAFLQAFQKAREIHVGKYKDPQGFDLETSIAQGWEERRR